MDEWKCYITKKLKMLLGPLGVKQHLGFHSKKNFIQIHEIPKYCTLFNTYFIHQTKTQGKLWIKIKH